MWPNQKQQTMNLIDNDIAVKISQYDLVGEFFHSRPSDNYVLPTLKFRFQLQDSEKAVKKLKTEYAFYNLMAFVASCQELSEEAPEGTYAQLLKNPSIDIGEALLFSIGANEPDSLTFTGDKRSIEAIHNDPSLAQIKTLLTGKIKCLEQVVAEIIINDQTVVFKKLYGHSWDTTIRIVSNSSDVDQCLDGLKNYYNHLNTSCGNILAPFPC